MSADPKKDPCKVFACRIQHCLKTKEFQENSCIHAINAMKECCMKWKDASYVCDGFRSFFEQPDVDDKKVPQ